MGIFRVLIYDLRGCGFSSPGDRRRGSALPLGKGRGARSRRPSNAAARRRDALSCPREMRYEGQNVYSRFALSPPRPSFRAARKDGDKRRRLIPLIGTRASFASRGNRWCPYVPLIRAMLHTGSEKIFCRVIFFLIRALHDQ